MKTPWKTSMFMQPYPYFYEGWLLIRLALMAFIMTVFFNYLFEPFTVYVPEHKMDFFWICVVHAIVSFVIILGYFSLLNLIPSLEESWKIREEILAVFGVLLMIGIGQFLIRDLIYDNPCNWSWKYLFEEVRNTMLVGGLFIVILVPVNFNRLNRNHQSRAGNVNVEHHYGHGDVKGIQATTQVKADDFLLQIEELVFVRSERNYVDLFIIREGSLRKMTKRISLKDLETQLSGIDCVVRTHRSYLVNLNYLQQVTGNAQGYKLKLKQVNEMVPVSRSFIPSFERIVRHP